MPPKATIQLANGARVTIEGQPEEVARLMGLLGGRPASKSKAGAGPKVRKKPKGVSGHVLELKEAGFFKGGKSLEQVREALAAAGYIFGANEISPALLRFRRGSILGRVKKGGVWVYTHRE